MMRAAVQMEMLLFPGWSVQDALCSSTDENAVQKREKELNEVRCSAYA
jgi:hypothetical protein